MGSVGAGCEAVDWASVRRFGGTGSAENARFADLGDAAVILGPMQDILRVSKLSKTYASGFTALRNIDLAIGRGEIFALLGPNGAGKTTLISIVCGIVNASSGSVSVAGHDIVADYRAARTMIGLVPQELSTDA